ncbi:MAG TPA: calcium-binding protein [Solirubrobacteraceae bacterium]
MAGGLALAAPAAEAGTLTVTSTTLSYAAYAGEANDVAVEVSGGNTRFSDTGAAITVGGTLPAGCVRDAPAPDTHQVRCTGLALASATVTLGDQDDTAHAFGPIKLTANGGPGVDTLIGGTRDDVLNTGTGDKDFGQSDEEKIEGGLGNDTISAQQTTTVFATGNEGNDSIYGPRDDPSLVGSFLWGDAGNDTLVAYDGQNVIYGGSGDDHLTGGASIDYLYPTFGDRLHGFKGPTPVTTPDKDTVAGGGGSLDFVSYEERSNPLWVTIGAAGASGEACAPGSTSCEGDTIAADVERVFGGTGDDHLTGDSGNNALAGNLGRDTLDGKGGADGLCGDSWSTLYDYRSYSFTFSCNDPDTGSLGMTDADNDTLIGGDGNDALAGNFGADSISGGAGIDFATYVSRSGGVVVNTADGLANDGEPATASKPAERDTVKADVERIEGGRGDDKLTGSAAANQLWGGTGNDTLAGGAGADILCGGPAGSENGLGHYALCEYTYLPQDGNDVLSGGDGDDTLDGGKDSNTLNGGLGLADTVSYADREEPVDVSLDNVRNDGANCPSACQNDSVGSVASGAPDVENIVGGDAGDTLTASSTAVAANVLDGGWGPDTLSGGPGADMLLSTFGYFPAGAGDADTFIGGTGFDYASYADGRDAYPPFLRGPVFARIDGTPSSGDNCGDPSAFNCERDTIRTDVEGLIGTRGDDTLSGSGFGNTLDGRLGADVLNGSGGNDYLVGGSGAYDDQFSGGDGADRLNSRDDNPGEDLVCGAGADTVTEDVGDNASVDCETVNATAVSAFAAGADPASTTVRRLERSARTLRHWSTTAGKRSARGIR